MPSITAAESESEQPLGDCIAIVLGREELDNKCAGLMAFLCTMTLWTCWLGIMKEKPPLTASLTLRPMEIEYREQARRRQVLAEDVFYRSQLFEWALVTSTAADRLPAQQLHLPSLWRPISAPLISSPTGGCASNIEETRCVFVVGGGLFVCFCLSLALNVAPGLDIEALTTPGLLPGAHATGDLSALPSGAVKCSVLLQAIAGIHLPGSLDYVDLHGRIYQSPKSSGPALGTIQKLPRGSLHRLLTRTLTRPVTHSEQKN